MVLIGQTFDFVVEIPVGAPSSPIRMSDWSPGYSVQIPAGGKGVVAQGLMSASCVKTQMEFRVHGFSLVQVIWVFGRVN